MFLEWNKTVLIMWKFNNNIHLCLFFPGSLLLLGLMWFTTNAQASDLPVASSNAEKIFARIDDLTISYGEFVDIFRAAVRHKYYHGKVPEDELKDFQKQVAEEIVIQILIHREAIKQGLKPDDEKIRKGLDEYDKKYSASPDWQAQRNKIIPLLLSRLERQDLIEQMQRIVKSIEKPEKQLVKKYYQQHAQKFTEPKRLWVSVILLSVPPSADKKMWSDAVLAAQQFKERIENGEDFATLARKYSGHPSAVNGGDLGYLHQGMLDGDAHAAINDLEIGHLSDPVHVLEGVTLFRLNGVQPEKLKPFNEVEERAADLLLRELQEEAWHTYTSNLLASSNIYVNEELYVHNDEK